jgi:ATP/maltotriose-dependent transcriptional regulator MalT
MGPAPYEVERLRLRSALAMHGHLPVRALCAPAGSGKTTFLRQYVRVTLGAHYLAGRPGLTLAALREALAAAAGPAVVLDDFDLLDPLVATALVRAVASGALGPHRLIVAGRSRSLLHVQQLMEQGLALVLDARDLAFDLDEAKRLAERLGLAFGGPDIARLVEMTDGWPLALSWILRAAAEDGLNAHGAVERWSARHGDELLEFLEENAFEDFDVRRAFMTAVSEAPGGIKKEWGPIEAAGGPVIRAEGELRPYRIIAALASRE